MRLTDVTERAEEHLRELIRQDAADPVAADRLAAVAVRRVRQRRDHRWAWLSGACLMLATAGTAVVVAGGPDRGVPDAHRSPIPSAVARPDGLRSSASNAAVRGQASSCAAGYSLETVATLAFAFDGTVTDIRPPRTNRPGRASFPLVSASFAVHEWFRGGSAATVAVDVPRPDEIAVEGAVSSLRVGSRLLVSGMPRWGGKPLDDPLAWTCGGFTRDYDAATARAWRKAFG